MLLLVECVQNQAVVLLMRIPALALHLHWPMKLDTSESKIKCIAVFRSRNKIFQSRHAA